MSSRSATVRASTVTAGSAAARSSAAGCSSPAITRLTSVPPCAAIGVVSELTGLGLLLDGEGVEPALGLAGATPPPRALGFAGCRGSGARPAADARVTLVEQWVIRHAVSPDVAPHVRPGPMREGKHFHHRPAVELDGRPMVKVFPLAHWTRADVWRYIRGNGVPYHPLLDQGYSSIGCWPCTRPTAPGEAERAGRWSGTGKTECGLHTFTIKQEA